MNQLSNTVVRVRRCMGLKFYECERHQFLRSESETGSEDASAAIRVSKDNRFLYASLRKGSEQQGKIVAFKLRRDGAIMHRIGVFSSGGFIPRDFTIVENAPDCNSYIAVVNKDSNNIVLFKRSRKTGIIDSKPAFTSIVDTPTSVLA